MVAVGGKLRSKSSKRLTNVSLASPNGMNAMSDITTNDAMHLSRAMLVYLMHIEIVGSWKCRFTGNSNYTETDKMEYFSAANDIGTTLDDPNHACHFKVPRANC